MEKVAVVARSFQAGTGEGGKAFDPQIFEKQVAQPISRLLKAEVARKIIVIINGEPNNRLAELPDKKGETPTMIALRERFPEETNRIIVSLCTDWGPNPGSAIALNKGLKIARQESDIKWVLNWSPEIEMDGAKIELGLSHTERHHLSVAGFLRQGWWERPQWAVVQNTAALWNIGVLSMVNGFAPECNGTDRTIKTEEYGEIPVAGMEDFHALLRMMKTCPDFRWGMVGRAEPLFWDTDFPAGSERLINHLKKVARQYQVMQIWAKDVFPELTFKKVMDRLFTTSHFD